MAGVLEITKEVLIEALIEEAAIECIAKSVLHRIALIEFDHRGNAVQSQCPEFSRALRRWIDPRCCQKQPSAAFLFWR